MQGSCKFSGASLNAIKWLAQYAFWYKHEKTHCVPWSGGIPPYKGEEPYAEGFDPAICMWTPDDWAFDPSFTDSEVEDLHFRRFYRHDIEILEQLAIASEESGWGDFEVYCTYLESLDLRCKTPMGFHPVRNDDELPDFCLEDWIFIRDCSPIDPGLSTASSQAPSDIESHRNHNFPSSPSTSPTKTINGKSNDRNETPLEYEGLRTYPADEIDTGAWDTRENFPAHLRSPSESSQSKPIPYTHPKTRSPWNTELGTVHLASAPFTQLLSFETTKRQISSHAQETLKSNRYHELFNLEQNNNPKLAFSFSIHNVFKMKGFSHRVGLNSRLAVCSTSSG
ncbi:hypothetical protein BGAL_0442g00090 [Botrytis galanthina]|uniref:Uncharacterized protein n=1 Tax=Botrytis galanthina TaxID=278940 RepID=A0A4S8QQ39_9HELO|nr:hypothetical protein BGAL_0442g00090 [Botrytis galanthina]